MAKHSCRVRGRWRSAADVKIKVGLLRQGAAQREIAQEIASASYSPAPAVEHANARRALVRIAAAALYQPPLRGDLGAIACLTPPLQLRNLTVCAAP